MTICRFLPPFCVILFALSLQAQPSDSLIVADDFDSYRNGSDGSPDWMPVKGFWQVIDGSYLQTSAEYDCASMLGDYLRPPYQIVAEFEHVSGEVGAGFMFHSSERGGTGFAQMVRFDGGTTFLMGYFQRGEFTGTASARSSPIQPGSNLLTLRVEAKSYSVYLNGLAIAENVPLKYRSGYAGLESSGGSVAFRRVRIIRTGRTVAASPFEWIKNFRLIGGKTFLIPRESEGTVMIADENGTVTGTIGTPADSGGQLHKPVDAIKLDDSTVVVCDGATGILHAFDMAGIWKYSSSGTETRFSEAAGIMVDQYRNILVADKKANTIFVFDDQLRFVTGFGKDRLDNPAGVAAEGNRLYILSSGESRVQQYHWDGKKPVWSRSISYGGGEARSIEARSGTLYLSLVNRVIRMDTLGRLLSAFEGRSVGFVYPWGMHIGRDGALRVADYARGRILLLDSMLTDTHVLSTNPDTASLTVTWKSLAAERGRLLLMKDNDTITSRAESVPGRHHAISIAGLTPNTTYHVRVAPTIPSIPPDSGFSEIYPLTSPAGMRTKQFSTVRMAAILFTNMRGARDSITRPVTEEEVQRVGAQLRDGVRFYWIHSGMRLWIDLQVIPVTESFTREQVYGNEWWYPPRESLLAAVLERNGRTLGDFQSYLYLTFTRQYDSAKSTVALAGKGGGFTTGVGTGKGFGISWWDVTPAAHNAGNNWLMVHEFNHQLDDIFLASGYPEYWFNHISPTIGTAAKFGEHFDANAHILRIVPEAEWYDLRYTRLSHAADADEDGIPDDDPSLPLDEKRLGSNPDRDDTDGDGVPDPDELRFSNWIVEGWGEDASPAFVFPNLLSRDTDGDGTSDGIDATPCVAIGTKLGNALSEIGRLRKEDFFANVFGRWDDDSLRFRVEMSRAAGIKLMLDSYNDGWFTGRDNLLLTMTVVGNDSMTTRVQLFDGSDPEKWPTMDSALAARVGVGVVTARTDDNVITEITVGRTAECGIDLQTGERLGISIGFQIQSSVKTSRYVMLGEPNRFFEMELEKK